MNIVTWNMQGSNASTENKWNTQVATILTSNAKPDFICLQESGPVPPSAVERESKRVTDPSGNAVVFYCYEWKGTESRPSCGIVFYEWDSKSRRVNPAIVFRHPSCPSQMEMVWGGVADWRPALGAEFNGRWIYSFHAISPRGPDAASVVAAAAANAKQRPWLVAGDFNREPKPGFEVPPGSAIREPDANTFSVKKPESKYDYCVSTAAPKGKGDVMKSVLFSDHYPVLFQF